MSDQMFPAVQFNPATGALQDATLPVPQPMGHDLLVRVAAVSLNPVDLKRRGMLAAEATPIRLGYDAAGVVAATGPEAVGFHPDDRVFYAGAVTRDGSNGAYHLVDARLVARIPDGVDNADAAAMPLTALTAWEGLFERLGYAPDPAAAQSGPLLVINGAGGVGSVALQLAAWAGIAATATASRPDSAAWCRAMGAARVVDHGALADLPDMSFAAILCAHDTDAYFDQMTRLVAPHGRIVTITGLRQPQNLIPLFQKSASFGFEYMFTRSTFGTADMARQGQILARVADLMAAGALKSTRTETVRGLSAASLQTAHDSLALGRTTGKLVIVL